MSRTSHCRCLLCAMERHLISYFTLPEGAKGYRELAEVSSSLSAFPAACDLIAYLHGSQIAENGHPSKNRILSELLQHSSRHISAAQEFLLLAFVPMLHRISRQVLLRSPALSADDIAQHVVTSLLASFESGEFTGQDSHLAFGIARLLRRNAFNWAEREGRGSSLGSVGADTLEQPSVRDGAEPMERSALLHHFLDRCQRHGVLSGEDLELLVQFKLEEPQSAPRSNAARQRMKRLVGKLRRAAGQPRRPKPDDRQLRLF
jgi:hypothetical protein